MFRRSFVFAAAVLVAALLAPSALALDVHVRVEGPHATIFGSREPLLAPVTGTFTPPDGPAVTLAQPTPLGALERASRRGDFYYELQAFSFGSFVARIGRHPTGPGSSGWLYKVNGVLPPVGADTFVAKEGDRVLWYFVRDFASGNPATLDLVRGKAGCFRVLSVDDAGARTRARAVVFRLDGESVRSARGRICPVGHWHTLKATKPGSIRSELVHR